MKRASEILNEIATKRLGTLTAEQLAIVESCLDTAERFVANEITLEEAMVQTDGGVIRSQVTMVVGSGSPRADAWRHLMDEIANEIVAGEGMYTKHGYIPFGDVGLHTRGRVIHKQGVGRVIEFQCPSRSGWFWPSEVSPDDRYAYQQQGKPSSEDILRQRTKWHDPPPEPEPADDEPPTSWGGSDLDDEV